MSATEADLQEFAECNRELADAAARLIETLRPDVAEGARIVEENARRYAREAGSGELRPTPGPSSLPLRRPFGDWDYRGPEADAVYEAMRRVEHLWHERLGRGTLR